MRALRLAVAIGLVLGLAGCGGSQATVMPDVVGKQLDVAKSDIQDAGFTDKVEVAGGGVLGVVVDSNWQVCDQRPAAGGPVTDAPRLTVDRSCSTGATAPAATPAETTGTPREEASEEPAETPTNEASPSDAPTPDSTTATDITVDALYDKLNSAGMGGVNLGDQFRLTTQFVRPDLWAPTASGDLGVMVQDAGGAIHIEVLAKRSDAAGWQAGMHVEMVVEDVQLTINGETGHGYLRVVSVKTIS